MLTYLNRNERITEISEYVRPEPYYTGFGGNHAAMQKIKEALRAEEFAGYVIVNQFDKKGLKTSAYKLVDGQVVHAFITLEEIKLEATIDSPDNFTVVWLP